MKQLLAVSLLYFLLTASLVVGPEAVSVLAGAILALWVALNGLRLPRGWAAVVFPLIVVLLFGLSGSSGHERWDVLRDFWALAKSVLLFVTGYFLAWSIVEIEHLLRPFLAAAAVTAMVHVWQFLIDPSLLEESIGDIRNEAGRGFMITVLSIGILVGARRAGPLLHGLAAWQRRAIFCLCAASIVLSFSRTFVVSTTIMATIGAGGLALLEFRSYTVRATKRFLVVGAGVAFVLFAGYKLASETEVGTDFISKVARSAEEVSVRDYSNRVDISYNWRGYETNRAFLHYREGSAIEHITGRGYGTLVDTGVHMQLGASIMRYVSSLHNGYVDLLLKTGLAGLLLYLLFFYRLIRVGLRETGSQRADLRFSGELLVACSLVLLVTTLVVSGLMNKQSMNPAILLIGATLAYVRRAGIVQSLAAAG